MKTTHLTTAASLKQKKRALLRELILETATHLFSKNGYESTSIESICRAANVVKGTFYYNFRSKQELVLTIREKILLQRMESANTALHAGAPPLRVMEEILEQEAQWTEKNPEIAYLFLTHLTESKSKTQRLKTADLEVVEVITSIFSSIVKASQNSGELNNQLDATEMTEMIIAVVNRAQLKWLLDRRPNTLSVKIKSWCSCLLDGMAQH